VKLTPDKMAFCIGDVSGKGVPGAIMMSMLYTGYRGLVHEYGCTCDTVAELNKMITLRSSIGTYATFFYGILDHQNMKLQYTNAGHNPPYLFKRDGRVIELKKGGIVLGFMADQTYEEEVLSIDQGDILVLFTDGVTESFNDQDEMYGEERVIQLIETYKQASADELKEKLIQQVLDFVPDTERQDDITVMIIKMELPGDKI
jgi:sigma-B regulation protein RsbU (phosphoserine phosphatase)